MIASHDTELVAIGGRPSNLALAVALEELAPDLAARTLLIEQHDDVAWQRGMLLPTAVSQVSFLKDLVTLRNPRSEFSFVNYLHSVGRLDDFINLASFTPYRLQISNYLAWVAQSLTKVRAAVYAGRSQVTASALQEPRRRLCGEMNSVHHMRRNLVTPVSARRHARRVIAQALTR